MDRYTREGRHPSMAEYADSFNASFRGVSTRDQGSVSGSEDDSGGYLVYPDPNRMDDFDDDPNNSLTSQTLNADGTPKRPMNAFMIFARRRRPQVSAENQSMRTGDVSKILSREWNAMDSSEKQFYLDQAKLLKENFNSKYPDYVYRRRPNNSRKKRRPDSTTTTTDSVSGDLVDEQSPHPDSDISPVDHYDSQERYGSSGPETTYDPPYIPAPRASSYQQAESMPYHPYGASDRRVSYMSSHEPVSSDTAMGPSTPSASGGSTGTPYYPSYVPNASNPQVAPYFQSQTGNAAQWHASRSNREDQGRVSVQSWSHGQESSLHPVDERHRQYQLPQASSPSWAGASPPEPQASNSSSVHAPNYVFPTLNSPFYPSRDSSHNLYPTKHSPPQMSDTPHQYGAVGQVQGSSATSRQEGAYGHYSTMQGGYRPTGGSAMHQYHTHSQNAVHSTPLPAAQTMPIYPHQQSMNSTTSPAGSATDPSSQLQ